MLAILDEDSKNEINNVKAQPKVSEQVKKVSLDPLDRKKIQSRKRFQLKKRKTSFNSFKATKMSEHGLQTI